MHGNHWEWCLNWHADDWYATVGSPTEPVVNPTGPTSGTNRAGRGGSYSDDAAAIRSALRSNVAPSKSYSALGFRLYSPKP